MTLDAGPVRWYASFYWRIGISFVVLVVVVLAGQSLMVSYARTNGAFMPGNPNATAIAVAARLGTALTVDPDVDPSTVLATVSSRGPAVYVVLTDGRNASTSTQPLRADIARQARTVLTGERLTSPVDDTPTGPVVTAPIQAAGRLVGLVILPPPPPRGLLANVGELLSLPGTLVLIAATAVAAFVIFAPARNRLRTLERAAEDLGGGRLETRAPVQGRDEIARVALAFNRMAEELQERTAALGRSDRLRRQMFADVSHELRTPLTTMRGYLDTLDMPEIALDVETRRRYLETVRRETRRLEHIVADLLDLARFESAAASLDVRVVAIERLFAGVARRYEREAADAHVAIRTSVSPAADQITADPDRLDQALSNLVANALRHTPPGGSIVLDAAADGDGCRLSVTDSGSGIPSAHLPYVFDRFYKAEASRTAGAGGSGLGLSIVKAIVERHGGTISVASEPGRTRFEIALPREAAFRDQSRSANL